MPDVRTRRWAGWVGGLGLVAVICAAVWGLDRDEPAAFGAAPEQAAAITHTATFISPSKPAMAASPTAVEVPATEPNSAASATEPPALQIPVQGIAARALRDTFADGRDNNGRGHEAIDIMAARGTPVLAVDDGPIVKLFLSKPGGITIYQFDSSRQFAYYYAHLDRYAEGLAEGQFVRRGSVIGYVGFSGNASPDAPHLHFAIFRLGLEKQWWKGEPINPFGYLGGKKP